MTKYSRHFLYSRERLPTQRGFFFFLLFINRYLKCSRGKIIPIVKRSPLENILRTPIWCNAIKNYNLCYSIVLNAVISKNINNNRCNNNIYLCYVHGLLVYSCLCRYDGCFRTKTPSNCRKMYIRYFVSRWYGCIGSAAVRNSRSNMYRHPAQQTPPGRSSTLPAPTLHFLNRIDP